MQVKSLVSVPVLVAAMAVQPALANDACNHRDINRANIIEINANGMAGANVQVAKQDGQDGNHLSCNLDTVGDEHSFGWLINPRSDTLKIESGNGAKISVRGGTPRRPRFDEVSGAVTVSGNHQMQRLWITLDEENSGQVNVRPQCNTGLQVRVSGDGSMACVRN
jgi:hypothetical protein